MNVAIANNADNRAAYDANKQRLIALGIDAILKAHADQAEENMRDDEEATDGEPTRQEGCCNLMWIATVVHGRQLKNINQDET